MRLKPKSTTRLPRALLYRRYIGLEKAMTLNVVYLTTDSKYWVFDGQNSTFNEIEQVSQGSTIVNVTNVSVFAYQGKYYRYNNGWVETTSSESALALKFADVGKYQTNKYYFVGSFDYMIKGSVEGATTQQIKGNIIPLTSLNIKHFNDDIELGIDDLVVIENHLYSVENPETTIKMQPKPYKVYFATLNSIL